MEPDNPVMSPNEGADALLVLAERAESEPTEQEQEAEAPHEATESEAGTENEAEAEESTAEADEDTGSEDEDTSEDAETEDEGQEEQSDTYTVKVGGQEREVTLEELSAGYSKGEDYTKKTEALASERKQFEADRTAAVDEFRNKFEQLNTQLASMDDGLKQYESIDWDALEQSDPEQAATLDRQMRRDTEKRDKAARLAAESAQMAKQQELDRQKPLLLERIPEWQDPEVYKRDAGAVASYLHETYGATPQEISNLVDHRLIDLARKARLYDEGLKAKPKKQEIVKKKVAGKPKVLKPGAAKPRRGGKDEQIADKQKHARRTGNIRDAAAAVEAMFNE